MSLILDALKRSERERNGGAASPSTSRTRPEPSAPAPRWPWVIGAGVGAILSAAVLVIVFKLGPPDTPEPPTSVTVAETAAPAAPVPASPAAVSVITPPAKPPLITVQPKPPAPVVVEPAPAAKSASKPTARLAGVTAPKPIRNNRPVVIAESDIRQAERHYIRAQALDRAGKPTQAIEEYTRAILLKPGYHEAFFGRGWVHESRRRHDSAIRDFSKAIDIAPNFVEAYLGRAWAVEQTGKTAEALVELSRVIGLDPNHGEAYFSRGFLSLYGGDPKAAAADFGAFERITKQPATADYARLWRYIALHRAGVDKGSVLDAPISSADPKSLPATLIRLFRDDADTASVIKATANPDPKRRAANQCIGYFFIAQQQLILGRKSEAAGYFRKALATGVTTLRQYAAAGKELALIENHRK